MQRIVFIFLLSVLAGFITTQLFLTKTHTVFITKEGFIPDSVKIRKGDTVTWVNKDTKAHWPASNSHPTHTLYPSNQKGCIGSILDACRGLKNGEKYSFKFDELGSWGMHDHLFPGSTMSVTVGKQNKEYPLATDFKNLPDAKDFRQMDYAEKRELIKALSKKDPVSAWNYLKNAALENSEVVDNVHEFAHTIGHEIYNKEGLNGITLCTNDFAYGCFHGVTEKMLLASGVKSVGRIEKECIRIFPPGNKAQPKDPGCIHGIGHGLLSFWDFDIKKALSDCGLISSPYRNFCYNGIFMEYSMSVTKPLSNYSNPWDFCLQFEKDQQIECAAYLPQLIMKKDNVFDIENLSEICLSVTQDNLKDKCLSAIGQRITQNRKGKIEAIISDCNRIISQTGRAFCFAAAARSVAFQKYTNWQITAPLLCQKVITEIRSSCENYEELQ